MSTHEQRAQEFFTRNAAHYVTSPAHTDEATLARLLELAAPAPEDVVLDIATGGGHAALTVAPHVQSVVATDLTYRMLATARDHLDANGPGNVICTACDAHDLPFPDATFNLVLCRRAAHHFTGLPRALAAMHRVLRPQGRLIIDDRSAPENTELDALLNELDTYHDRSHVRQHPLDEWRELLGNAGFTVTSGESYTRSRPIDAFTNGALPEDVQRIHDRVNTLSDDAKRKLGWEQRDGKPCFNHWYVMLEARAAE